MDYPKCFPNYEHYRSWVELARLAREVVSPCDDCNVKYQLKMKNLDLCDRDCVKTIIIRISRKKADV